MTSDEQKTPVELIEVWRQQADELRGKKNVSPLVVQVYEDCARQLERSLTEMSKDMRAIQLQELRRLRNTIEKDMEEREQARERLREAGYDDSEIPL